MTEVPPTAKRLTDKNGRECFLTMVERSPNNPRQFFARIKYIDDGSTLYVPYEKIEKYL